MQDDYFLKELLAINTEPTKSIIKEKFPSNLIQSKLYQYIINTNSDFNIKNHNLKHNNILICGKTGVGKKTLLNQIKNISFVETSKDIEKQIENEDPSLSKLFTSKTQDISLADDKQDIFHRIASLINDKAIKEDNPDNFIHCVWYCVFTLSLRLSFLL